MRFLRAAGLTLLLACLAQAPHRVWAQSTPDEEVTDDEDEEEAPEPPPPPPQPLPLKVAPAKLPPKAPPPAVDPDEVTEDPDEEEPEAPPPEPEPEAEAELTEDQEEAPPDAGQKPAQREPRPREEPLRLPDPKAAEAAAEAASVVSEHDLKQRIEARAAAVRSGDSAMADLELGLIEETRKAIGAPNVVLASAQLIHESKQALEAGLFPRAEALADAAVRLSPDLPAAHWMRLRAYTAGGWTRLGPIAGALFQLGLAQLSTFRNVLGALSAVLILFGFALLGLATIYTAVQLFKYLRYPAHDIAELFPGFISGGEIAIVLVLLLGLPLVLGFGPMPTLVLGLTLVAGYQIRRERILSIALLVLLGSAPGLLYLASPLVTFHGSIADALATASGEALAGDAERRVTELIGPNRDFAASVILAHRQRQRGDLVAAEAQYQQALKSNPSSVLARNNLGVVLFLLGREDAAEAAFKAAAGAQQLAEPSLNLSSIYFERGDFDLGKTTLEQARRVDAALTERYTSRDSTLPLRTKLLEARVGQGLLWERLLDSGWPEGWAVMSELWRPFGQATAPMAMPVIALLGLVLSVLIMRRDHRLSVPCPKCGIPATRRAPAQFCTQCHSVFLTSVAVEPALRHHKEAQVRGYQRRRRWYLRIFSLCAGSGHLFGGRPLLGATLLLPFLVCLGRIYFQDQYSVHSWRIFVDASANSAWSVAAAVVGLILVLTSLRSASEQ